MFLFINVARELKEGIQQIRDHRTTHVIVSAQAALLRDAQREVSEHMLEYIDHSLLIQTLDEDGNRVVHPFTQLALVG